MAILSSDLIRQGASGASTGYTINQSIRFNSADNPKLGKTFSGAGTEETWTFSCWFKRGGAKEETRNMIFSAGSAGNNFGGLELGHGAGVSYGRSPLIFYNYTSGSYNWRLQTSMAFGDFSAWYHVVAVSDTTNTVASERARLYVNGQRITDFSSAISAPAYPSLNFAGNFWMGTTEHEIGTSIFTSQDFDGYLAEIHNIDGYAYGPEFFGEFKEDTDIWIPKEYTGSYGTNGFKIDGRDSGDLGDDESGQGNDFSTSGLAAHDKMIDTPTNNFCTMHSAAKHTDSGFTISNGNLDLTRTAGNNKGVVSTIGLTSGKWYWEVRTIHGTSYNIEHGVIGEDAGYILTGTDVSTGSRSSGYSLQFNTGDYYKYHGGSNSDTGVNATSPSFQAFALDMDNNKIWFGYAADGDSSITWFESGDPAGGSNAIYDLDDGSDTYYACHNSSRGNGTQVARFNFGQDGSFAGEESASQTDSNGEGNFFFAPPSGFLAICTKNLQA